MPELGKKVFFLYPPSVVTDELVWEVVRNEYEVYLLKDHKGLGRRYVRAQVLDRDVASFNVTMNGIMQTGFIRDISSVGMAAYFEPDTAVPVRTYLRTKVRRFVHRQLTREIYKELNTPSG